MEFIAVILIAEGGGLMSLLLHCIGLTHYSNASKNSDTQLTFIRGCFPFTLALETLKWCLFQGIFLYIGVKHVHVHVLVENLRRNLQN